MTALPQQRPRRLSVDEFAALPEVPEAHCELQEGAVVMSPRPANAHQRTLLLLGAALEAACPPHLLVLPEVDVDLELAAPGRPGFVRAPDLVVARRETVEGSRMLRAADLVLVVEIRSPGTRRTDTVVKRAEYADAGIPRYWIVDAGSGAVSLTAAHLGGEFGYVDDGPAGPRFVTDQPFPLRLDLATMR